MVDLGGIVSAVLADTAIAVNQLLIVTTGRIDFDASKIVEISRHGFLKLQLLLSHADEIGDDNGRNVGDGQGIGGGAAGG